jgi:hypothetical protein
MKKETKPFRDAGVFQKKLIDQVADDLVQIILEANPETQELSNAQALLRKRAEEIYKQRISSGTTGDALSDWLQAEKDIKNK